MKKSSTPAKPIWDTSTKNKSSLVTDTCPLRQVGREMEKNTHEDGDAAQSVQYRDANASAGFRRRSLCADKGN
jgi:hypothetical protein